MLMSVRYIRRYNKSNKSDTMNEAKKPVMECVREFKLRQQYPSMIQKSKDVGKIVIINTQAKNGFRKIRLKLPSGQDLGECNVKISPNNKSILKGRVVTIAKQNKCKTFNKSTTSYNKTKDIVENIPLRSINSTIHKDVVASPNIKHFTEASSKIKCNSIIERNINLKKNRDIENVETDTATVDRYQKKRKLEYNKTEGIVEDNKQPTNKNSFSELSDYLSFSRPVKVVNGIPIIQLIEVPNYPVNISDDVADAADIVEYDFNAGNSVSQNNCRLDAKKKLYTLSMEDRNINLHHKQNSTETDLKSSNCSFTQQNVNLMCDKNIHKHKKMMKKNALMIPPYSETSLLNNDMKTIDEMDGNLINNRNHDISNNSTLTFTASSSYKNCKSQDVFPNVLQSDRNQHNIEQNIDKPSEENHVIENLSSKRKCSSCSVLKEVISAIENESLKNKALKAFENCGIEMEQQIPLNTPTNTRPETDLLVESGNLLNINENTSSTVKGSYCTNTLDNLNVNPLDYMLFYKNSTFSPFNQLQETDTLFGKYIDDNVITDICNQNSTAKKVKEVLSQPNISSNRIFEQLQRDFENVRNLDINGMLNIHNAVITNRKYDVQRQLLVIKACNVNVDIPTESGMTSLELAIKNDVAPEIVKLLLEAGANPASLKSIHDSALIMASKINSPLLPLLVNHVPCTKLLDNVDFTGFTALHYCAQNGNFEGANSLIKMGANVNLQESRSGRTPLFLSVENGHLLIAERLIESGAQRDIPNFSGQTIMPLVEKIKHFSLITLLHNMK